MAPSHNPPPTLVSQVYQHQQNLNVSVDASLLAEAANARHTEVVQLIHSENREQMNAMELNAMSHVAQLRLEHAQLQNRAKYIEEEAAQNLQAGRHAVARHQIEAAAATEQAEHLRVRPQSAEVTATNVVAQVEAEAARRAQASQADAAARSDEFARRRSEMQEMMRIQALSMDQLRQDNAQLKNRLAEAEAESPTRRPEQDLPPGLSAHPIFTPPWRSRLVLLKRNQGIRMTRRRKSARTPKSTRRMIRLIRHLLYTTRCSSRCFRR